jgi:sugar phosphate isomerase/epimerase
MQENKSNSRRDFIRYGTALLGGLALPPFAKDALSKLNEGEAFSNLAKYRPRLSFSTLGCPDWDFEKITAFAKEHGYQGIEVRGIQREMDLPKSPLFSTGEARTATLKRMRERGLVFVSLGSSATMHFKDPAKRTSNLDDGKRFIDLAAQLNCPYVRIFPNNFPQDQTREETMDLIKNGFLSLCEYASGTNVTVLMETHGDLIHSADLQEIMEQVNHKKAGLIWDISNMWTVTREHPADVYAKIGKYVRHTHIKDAVMKNPGYRYVFVGKGEVPISDALHLLVRDRYSGYFSFEWEKLWIPELEEPELAIADYPKAIKEMISGIRS